MSAVAKIDLVFTPPPTFDWTDIAIGDDLKAMEKSFDRYEAETLVWRAGIAGQMQAGLKKVESALPNLPKELAVKLIQEEVGALLELVEQVIKSFSVPMHANPDITSRLETISKLSTKAGKFIRKLLRRAEKVRVAQHAACVDVYYGLLAFQSEHADDEDGKTFSNPAELGTFLRRQIA